MKTIKNFLSIIFTILFIASLFFGLMYYVFSSEKDNVQEISSNSKKTFARIIHKGNMKGNYVVLEYFVDSKRFKSRESCTGNTYQKGEYYEIEYSIDNPSNILVNFENMKFEKNADLNETDARVLKLNFEKYVIRPFYTVQYHYIIDNKKFTRFDKISNENYKKLKVDSVFKIKYLINNPKSAAPIFNIK